jgi:glycosyltransferase involved in cell wall biosynthesis
MTTSNKHDRLHRQQMLPPSDMSQLTVSVVLPVYNCPEYVGEALDSILCQTYTDFEAILIDDGSTDSTPKILKQYTDPRIRLITQTNRGLAATLNRGIELARGKYIARMDQDDMSRPERFAKQVAYLDAHPDCALLGTWAEIWQGHSRTERTHRHPADNSTLKFEMLFNNPFVHSSVMLRKSALDRVGVYSTDRSRQPPEDYELWSRIAREYEVANLPEILQVYREVPRSMSRNGPSPFLDHLVKINTENIASASKASIDNPSVLNIAALAHQATHRVQARPNLIEMRAILRRAVEGVVSTDDPTHFVQEAENRLQGWWFADLQNRYRDSWLNYFVIAARRGYRSYQALKGFILGKHK